MLLALLLSCGGEPPPITAWPVTLQFSQEGAPLGAHLFLGETDIGRLYRPDLGDTEHTAIVKTIKIEAPQASIVKLGLSVRVATPCGELSFPVSVDNPAYGLMQATIDGALPTTTKIWFKDYTKEVRVGGLVPEVMGDHYTVHGLDCAPRHEIVVNGASKGHIDTSGGLPVGYFLPDDTSRCHALSRWVYGAGGSKTEVLPGGAGVPIEHDKIDYLLTKAPDSVPSDMPAGMGGIRFMVELVEADCPTP